MRASKAKPGGLAALLAASALTLGACGSSAANISSSSSSSSRAGEGKGVAVIYAGSLSKLMEDEIGPGFERASGFSFEGFGGGSGEDAAQIEAKVRRLDVFVSASAAADRELIGAANGDWVSWYATFASTPLVLGYDPASGYGRQLAAGRPWYRVLTDSGIRVGRTDPKLDPKGALTVAAVEEAARRLHAPALQAALRSFTTFPETVLVGRLQSGQLDAGFFYAAEATAARVPTVSLAPAKRSAAYTVTILRGAPEEAGAEAFVRYLLRRSAAGTLARSGLTPIAPTIVGGRRASVPAGLRSVLGAGAP